MPFLRFKGFDKQVIEQVSSSIIEEFSNIVRIPADIVKMELLHAEPVANSPLSVEIYMFQREQHVHDAIASMIYETLSKYGFKPHIFFVILTPSLYYKEGKPLHGIPKRADV